MKIIIFIYIGLSVISCTSYIKVIPDSESVIVAIPAFNNEINEFEKCNFLANLQASNSHKVIDDNKYAMVAPALIIMRNQTFKAGGNLFILESPGFIFMDARGKAYKCNASILSYYRNNKDLKI